MGPTLTERQQKRLDNFVFRRGKKFRLALASFAVIPQRSDSPQDRLQSLYRLQEEFGKRLIDYINGALEIFIEKSSIPDYKTLRPELVRRLYDVYKSHNFEV